LRKLFFLFLLIFFSCSIKNSINNTEIKNILNEYSDILHLNRSTIYFLNSPPSLNIDLYLKNNVNFNNKNISKLRDSLLSYLRSKLTVTDWNIVSPYRYKYYFGFGYYFRDLTIRIHLKNNIHYSILIGSPELSLLGWKTDNNYKNNFKIYINNNYENFPFFVGEFIWHDGLDLSPLQLITNDLTDEYEGYYMGILQTSSNSLAYLFNVNDNIDHEYIKAYMTNYLNSEQFNLLLENDDRLFINYDFHILLLLIMPNDDIIEYTAYRNNNYFDFNN